jgi:branched-chain amino acid transport system ATP-binding protein
MNEAILSTHGLTKSFGGVVAVQDVTFTVRRGEVFGVIGPNGAGKSTLFNLLSAALPPSSGRIDFDGEPTARKATHVLARRGMARTFQNVRLFGDQSAVENVKLGAYRKIRSGIIDGLFGGPRRAASERECDKRALHWLDFVGLSQLAGRHAEDLSFGQQRQLELARALALEPSLLLLDEPASGLNDQETARLARLVADLPRLGMTVLVVEHNMQFMMEVAHRILVLDSGRKIAEGTPAQVRSNPHVISVYLGSEAAA